MTARPIPADQRWTDLSPAVGETLLAYDFPLYEQSGLTIIRTRMGAQETLVAGSDFNFNADWQGANGGTITLTAETWAGDKYLFLGLEIIQRISEYLLQQKFDPIKFNDDLNSLVRILQECRRDIDRSIQVDVGKTPLTIATIAEGNFWVADADGNMVDGGSAADIIQAQVYAAQAAASELAVRTIVESEQLTPVLTTQEWIAGIPTPYLPSVVQTTGWAEPGDVGGSFFVKRAVAPLHEGWFTFTANGVSAIYEIVGRSAVDLCLTPQMVGTPADNANGHDFEEADLFQAAKAALNGGAGPSDAKAGLEKIGRISDALLLPVKLHGHFWVSDVAMIPKGAIDSAIARVRGPMFSSLTGDNITTSINCDSKGCFAIEGVAYHPDGELDTSAGPNTQMHGTIFERISFFGPMDAEVPSNGLVVVNSRQARIIGCSFFGFTDGAGCVLFSQGDGGMFKPMVEQCYFGHDIYILGLQTRTEQQILAGYNAWGLRLAGRAYSIGRTNDLEMTGCLGYGILQAFLETKPDDYGGIVGNYGPGNINLFGTMAYSEAPRKFREGTMVQGASATEWILTHKALHPKHASDNYAPHNGLSYYLMAWASDDGRRMYKRISTYDDPTDLVDVSTAFPVAPRVEDDGSILFRITLTTNKIVARTDSRQCHPCFASLYSDENIGLTGINAEEFNVTLVVSDECKRVALTSARSKVSDSFLALSPDGTETSAPILLNNGFDVTRLGNIWANNHVAGVTHYSNPSGKEFGGLNGSSKDRVFDSFGAQWTETIIDPDGILPPQVVVHAGEVVPGMAVAAGPNFDGRTGGFKSVRMTTGINQDHPKLVGGIQAQRYKNDEKISIMKPGSDWFCWVAGDTEINEGKLLAATVDGLWHQPPAPAEPLVSFALRSLTNHPGDQPATDRVKILVEVL